MRTTIAVLLATYSKYDLVKNCIKECLKNAGINFEFWIWDNGSEDKTTEFLKKLSFQKSIIYNKTNIGLSAYNELAKLSDAEHIVTLDEDVIKFPKNWLRILLDAFYEVPKMKYFWPPFWGWLSLMVERDQYTNGNFWPEIEKRTTIINGQKYRFRIGVNIAQTCSMIHRSIYKKMGGFMKTDGDIATSIDAMGWPQGWVEDYKIYHACGPYYNKKYEKMWKERQRGQTINEALEYYNKLDPSLTFKK